MVCYTHLRRNLRRSRMYDLTESVIGNSSIRVNLPPRGLPD